MNSLKRIALISAIVCGIALLATIILTPFAVSSAITYYNQMVEKAAVEKDHYNLETTLDSSVNSLTLEDQDYYYRRIRIQESPDQKIHILTKDTGFETCIADVSVVGNNATLRFRFQNDIKLSEENLMQALAFAMDNYDYDTVIQLPAAASLHLDPAYVEYSYYNLDIQFTGFANYDEVMESYNNWAAAAAARDAYRNYLDTINNQIEYLNGRRYRINDMANNYSDQAGFIAESTLLYTEIKNYRSDMLKTSYNFRQEYSGKEAEALSSAYLDMQKLVSELGAQEQEYDLLTLQQRTAGERFNMGEITEETYRKIMDEGFDRQVDLDLSIGKLRQSFYDYLHEDILPENKTVDAETEPVPGVEVVPFDTAVDSSLIVAD